MTAEALETRRATLKQAVSAQRLPLSVLGAFALVGGVGLGLLGRPLCGILSFVSFFGLDFVQQRRLRGMAAEIGVLDPETGFLRLRLFTGLRHVVLLAGPTAALFLHGGIDEAIYLVMSAAAVLLLATYQCAFDRQLLLAAAAPPALAIAFAARQLVSEPHGDALVAGALLLIATCAGISLATAQVRSALVRRSLEKQAMLSELRRAHDAALKDQQRLQAISVELTRRLALSAQTARMTRIGDWELDLASGRLFCSEETLRIFEAAPDEEIDWTFTTSTYTPESRQIITRAMARLLGEGEPFDEELSIDAPGGGLTWIRCMGEVERKDGVVVRAIGSVQDISDRRAQEQRIYDLAYRDELTSLPNRTAFRERLARVLDACEPAETGCGLLLIDLDHFKDVNDTLGHDAGDELLRTVAKRLLEALGAGAMLSRLGGDEFAVLAPELESAVALGELAEVARRALELPILQGGATVSCSASLGAAFTNTREDPARFLKSADIALYEAKEAGRNRAVIFEPAMRRKVESRFELLTDVRVAIESDEFEPWYQPIVSLPEHDICSFEALIRWRRPGGEILTPVAFHAALQDTELSLVLSEMVLEKVLCQIKAWLLAGVAFGRIAVNFCGPQFRRADLAGYVQERLHHWGVSAEFLMIEITETVYLGDNAELVARAVGRLREMGAVIALDDFGTGYASLANLRQLPIQVLKIDKSFVSGDDEALVAAIAGLGARLGMQVVAEGVERPEQLAALEALGCNRAQGFLFSGAVPAIEVPGLLRREPLIRAA